ncbi:MAG: HepT-like ribonuclease domain-containing protein [Desulfomonilaceae bacterium]
MRGQRGRLLDILQAIEEIEEYAALGHDAYVQNKLIQGWMILHLQRIGEATARLSDMVRCKCPDIPWQDVVGMRNLLIHEYFGISLKRV